MVEKLTIADPVHRNGEMKRSQILEAAHHHFSHFGFSKATMTDIATELGMGKASLYYYYPTKEELFQAVLTTKHDAFVKELERVADANGPAVGKLRSFVEMRMDYFHEFMNLNLVDFQHWQTIRPQLRVTFRRLAQQEYVIIHQMIREGIRKGEIETGSPDKCAQALLQIMRGVRCQFLRTIDGPQVPPKDFQVLKREMMFIADIFLRGIKA